MHAPRLFDRAVIRLNPIDRAEDVAAFLQGLVTNDVSGALPVWAGLLSAQGKAMFDFLIWPGGIRAEDGAEDGGGDGGENGALLVDCEAAAADDLVKRLSLYRLRRKIEIARDESLGVYWQAGPAGDGAENAVPDPRVPELGQRWIAPVSADDKPVDAEWRAHRLSLGVPEGRADLGDILWLETNAAELNGVSFGKGCYIGQENTARMNWRQKVNRRLVVVPLDASDEKRRKASYPDLGLALDHRRVSDIPAELAPPWMQLRAADGPKDE